MAALAAYDLTHRERDRLARAVWQRGMDANCTMYRATRIAALHAVVPLTLDVIRPQLRDLLDDYWEDNPVHDVRFAQEAARFIDWLESRTPKPPDPAADLIALARRELAAEVARLASE